MDMTHCDRCSFHIIKEETRDDHKVHVQIQHDPKVIQNDFKIAQDDPQII